MDGFRQLEASSTGLILYQRKEGGDLEYVSFLDHPMLAVRPRLPLLEDHDVAICSASRGLIACRDLNPHFVGNYYVGNPFIEEENENISNVSRFKYQEVLCLNVRPNPSFYLGAGYQGGWIRTPPTFHVHHPHLTHVVLAVEHPTIPSGLLRQPFFHLICAVREGAHAHSYTFDAYSSQTGGWEPSLHGVDLQLQRHIVPHSGVSSRGFAFWLLNHGQGQPPSSTGILCYDIRSNLAQRISYWDLPDGLPADSRMQLGIVNYRLGLVVVNEARSRIELYAMQRPDDRNPWTMMAVFNVEISKQGFGFREREREEWHQQQELTIICGEMPRPIRFESFKVELMFWLQGRVLRLENSSLEPGRYSFVLLSQRAPARIAHRGLPFIFTCYRLPADKIQN